MLIRNSLDYFLNIDNNWMGYVMFILSKGLLNCPQFKCVCSGNQRDHWSVCVCANAPKPKPTECGSFVVETSQTQSKTKYVWSQTHIIAEHGVVVRAAWSNPLSSHLNAFTNILMKTKHTLLTMVTSLFTGVLFHH